MATFCVTGSAGHLGEALLRTLREQGHHVVGLDVLASTFTGVVGSVDDRDAVRRALDGADHVLHTATLHKPHVGSHTRQDFVDTNVTGTLTVLEAAAEAGARSVVFTSSTSAFGRSLSPAPGRPAVWIDETTPSTVRNIYGATKVAAEDLCELAARDFSLPVVVLRTARFFPEPDDRDDVRAAFDDINLKVNEFLHRRIDLADVVGAHLCAAARAPELGFGRYVVSATTPFTPDDLPELAVDAAAVVNRIYPGIGDDYARRAGDSPRRSTASTATRAPAATWTGPRATTSPRLSTWSAAPATPAAPSPARSAPRATTPNRPGSTPADATPDRQAAGIRRSARASAPAPSSSALT
jgi:nucleoside-diphosphate-sugar epimerase